MTTNQTYLGLHHIALHAENVNETVTFFQALGYRKVHQWNLPEYKIDTAAIPMQGVGAAPRQGVVTGALAHLCLAVSDLDTASAQIIATGATRLTNA